MNSSRREFLARTAAGAAGTPYSVPGFALHDELEHLVVLDADPLTDIRNTRKIHSVVTRGRVISPAARAKMLADVEAAVQEPPSALALPAGGCCAAAGSGH